MIECLRCCRTCWGRRNCSFRTCTTCFDQDISSSHKIPYCNETNPLHSTHPRGALGSQPTASKSKSKRRTEGLCSSWELNHEPFWCEVTALPTDPSCCKSSRTCWCIFKHIYWGILHSHECLEPNSVVPDFTHRWWHTFFLLFPSKNINECGDAPTTVLFVDIKPPQITQREKNSASG